MSVLRNSHIITIGKSVKKLAQLRGGGSALPGLVVEKLDSQFIARTLSQLPHGVVVISGTNGKTTTTKLVSQLLEATGLRVFTNRTGSNFTRGVAAALLDHVDSEGQLAADIAVLELDEAHAQHFIHTVPPRYSLILNVMRDQLDRFGEIDHTAALLAQIAHATTHTVVLNRDDPLIGSIGEHLPRDVAVQYFGLDPALRQHFPSDHDLYGTNELSHKVPAVHSGDVILTGFQGITATFAFGKKPQPAVSLALDGLYNILNAAAALALARAIIDDPKQDKVLLEKLATITPAFGRGETIVVNGAPIEVVLVKNPAGFRLALASYAERPATTLIAINDNYADGRDMSWLWDVDFSSFVADGIAVVSGLRAYDMALRLQYDDVVVRHITTELPQAIDHLLATADGAPMRMYCTYTAMLKLRRLLAQRTTVGGIHD